MNNIHFRNPDLHMHSTFSDGSDSPAELIQNVKAAGIDIFALTDHDCCSGCDEVKKLLAPGDPAFIGGVELSCADKVGKYHILGYCYDASKPYLRDTVDLTHKIRISKAENRFEYLKSLGFEFSAEDHAAILALSNPGRPHFAELLLKYGYAKERAEAFTIMANYHGHEKKLTPEEAIDAILLSDGIPVLAHGILADGSKNLSADEIEERVRRLKAAGLMGLECYYSTYTEEQKATMLGLADKYHMLITAGSDYHGKNKTIRLGETNSPDMEKMSRFFMAAEALL